jgi:hydroxymethylglutaryl-CoA synthase
MRVGIKNIGFYVPSGSLSDQDTYTLALEACEDALRYENRAEIGACYFGTETKPYAVKSTASMLVTALGLREDIFAADMEFACKAGTSAMQVVAALTEAGRIQSGIAIGSDIAEAQQGDVLADNVGSGAVGVVISSQDYFAQIIDYVSVADDVSDFWRSHNSSTPVHEGRFTGAGGYLKYVEKAYHLIQDKSRFTNDEIDHVVLHMPNSKFPFKILDQLGLDHSLINSSFVFDKYKNCFSACTLLGLRACLEKAKPGQNIVMISYGSGAGADAFLIKTNDLILEFQSKLTKKIWS